MEVGRSSLFLFFLLVLSGFAVRPGDQPDANANLDAVSRESVRWLSDYIRIDTSNPPGREARSAEFLASLLRKEGISCQVFSSTPGRANVYARIKGTTNKGGIALVHHMDVVPAEKNAWAVPPFDGRVEDGYVWGRGAIDSKGLGIVHLAALIGLKRSGIRPDRDIVFLATADEESGSRAGLQWIIQNRPRVLKGIKYALTEGGTNIIRDGHLACVGVETTQKIPVWLRVTAVGTAGHAAFANRDAAPHRLIRALDRLLRYQTPVVVDPAVAHYLRDVAGFEPPDIRDRLLHLDDLVRDPDEIKHFEPAQQVLLHNTISVTVVKAGLKTNYMPESAYAELDCRLVPSQDPDEFIDVLSEIINDSNVVIEPFLIASPAASSSYTELFQALRDVTQKVEKRAVVTPSVLPGFSDSRFLRELGIASYGFDPFKLENEQTQGVHGVDEKLAVSDLDFAIRYCFRVLAQFVL